MSVSRETTMRETKRRKKKWRIDMFLTKEQRRRRLLGKILFYIQAAAITYAAAVYFALILWLGK